MEKLRVHFDPIDAPQTKLDRAIEWLLIAILAFCPMTFGAVVAWSEGIFLLFVSAIAICLSVKLLTRPDARFVWSWAYLPIALFLILVIAQLIPLPAGVARAISPNTVALKTRLLADLPEAQDATRSMTLTFYTEATLRQLRLAAAMAVIFVAVLNVFQRLESIRRLLLGITLIGLGEAGLALAQDITHSTSIYWTVPVHDGRALSGTFVNHSHFGQFMNLCIGAAVGLWLLEWHTRGKHDEQNRRETAHMPAEATPGDLWESAPLWIAALTVLACASALLLSLTRGGVISMLIAGAFTLAVFRLKSRARGGLTTSVALLAAVVVLAAAWIQGDQIFRRFASITESNSDNWRGQMRKDLIAEWKQFKLVGAGLGTHSVVFPMFDRSQIAAVPAHAENEYLQTLAETGAIGLALALGFAALVWWCYARAIRGRFSSISAIAIGLGYGFAAILIHSLTDFGQHIPADASLCAVTCALLVSLARLRARQREDTRPPREFRGSIPARIAGAVVVAIFCGIGLYQAMRVWQAEDEWNQARALEGDLRRNDWRGERAVFDNLFVYASNASKIRPGNVEYACWVPIYAWKWISFYTDEHGTLNADLLPYARELADALNRVRLTCPTYGLPASMAGQIEKFVLADERGADRIRLGSELNRNDPVACFVDGQLAAAEGDWDRSLARMKHFGRLAPGDLREVVDLYVNKHHRPDLALAVSEGFAPALRHLAEVLRKKGEGEEIAAAAQKQADDITIAQADRAMSDFGTLVAAARIAIARNDRNTAINYMRRALQAHYGESGLRFELAKTLVEAGRKDEAITELKIATRQQPGFGAAEKLLLELDPPK